ncbi:magnesium transporter CorA family protein [Lentilactobacillus raoultii]|uniref:Magnesium transporter CorA family protein n=1 Tax=Lentilactobacillus raoultii TaxID=1987503 RepID=A0ABW3PBE5_9LACO|nr:magnesium transporter CorA family protein [Lentilactobacillus raoultii]
MIKIHKLKNYIWIEVVKPQADELDKVIATYQLPLKFKNYMLDRHEQPRATYDPITDTSVVVIRALASGLDSPMTTVPIFLGFNDDVMMTACHGEAQAKLVNQQANQNLMQISDHIFAILRALLSPYFDMLDEVSKRADKFASHRLGVITNRQLATLTTLKTRLVYLRSATAGNLVALEELAGVLKQKLRLTTDIEQQVTQQISDLVIEYKQCQAMFDVQSNVVNETEAAYGNILNNRLNQTMKFLTVWSLVLAIPPIVSGFYGMNVKLPFAGRNEAWIDTLILTIALMVLMLLIYRHRNKRQR